MSTGDDMTKGRIGGTSQLILQQVGRELERAARKVLPKRHTAGANVLGRHAATNLDLYWNASKKADEGKIDVIDMFSGCGGMSAGFRAFNGLLPAYRLVLAVDIDERANESYERNLGLAPRRLDISKLANDEPLLRATIAQSRRKAGNPLVLIGCAPCQGFSSHRNEAGAGDPRNSLFSKFAKIAVALQPEAVIVENVPELLTHRYWDYVKTARELLERGGYYVHLSVHNMASFGVAQERFRAVMIAMRKPFRPLEGYLSRPRFRTVRQAIGKMPPIDAGERCASDEMHYTAGHAESTLKTIRAVPKDGGNRPPDVGPPCLQRARIRNGRGAYDDVYGRLFWDRPAITITAYSRNPASGRFIHPEQDRGLSVREAALIQGFPRDYWFSGPLDERFRQVGNAVPPIFSIQLATHVVTELMANSVPVSHDPGLNHPCGASFSRLIPALKMGRDLRTFAQPRADLHAV